MNNEYEQILRLWLKTDETKNRKRKFHHDYNDKFFIYICLIFLSSIFLFFEKPCLKRKRYLPTVTTCNATRAVYNCIGGGVALGETELS